jgi:hypothetical protein
MAVISEYDADREASMWMIPVVFAICTSAVFGIWWERRTHARRFYGCEKRPFVHVE